MPIDPIGYDIAESKSRLAGMPGVAIGGAIQSIQDTGNKVAWEMQLSKNVDGVLEMADELGVDPSFKKALEMTARTGADGPQKAYVLLNQKYEQGKREKQFGDFVKPIGKASPLLGNAKTPEDFKLGLDFLSLGGKGKEAQSVNLPQEIFNGLNPENNKELDSLLNSESFKSSDPIRQRDMVEQALRSYSNTFLKNQGLENRIVSTEVNRLNEEILNKADLYSGRSLSEGQKSVEPIIKEFTKGSEEVKDINISVKKISSLYDEVNKMDLDIGDTAASAVPTFIKNIYNSFMNNSSSNKDIEANLNNLKSDLSSKSGQEGFRKVDRLRLKLTNIMLGYVKALGGNPSDRDREIITNLLGNDTFLEKGKIMEALGNLKESSLLMLDELSKIQRTRFNDIESRDPKRAKTYRALLPEESKPKSSKGGDILSSLNLDEEL